MCDTFVLHLLSWLFEAMLVGINRSKTVKEVYYIAQALSHTSDFLVRRIGQQGTAHRHG